MISTAWLSKQKTNYALSSSSDDYSYADAAGGYVDVTNLSVTIQLSGKAPVLLLLVSNNTYTRIHGGGGTFIKIYDSGDSSIKSEGIVGAGANEYSPSGIVGFDPTPSAGSHTYKVAADSRSGSGTYYVYYVKLLAIEL